MYKTKQPPFYKSNTNDSTPELALFYNMALDRMNELLSVYEDATVDLATLNFSKEVLFKENTYLHLQVYLWKEQVSNSFATLTQNDRHRVHQFLEMMVHLRNFQSHYYHDSRVLKFPKDLIQFIKNRFALAEQDLKLKNPNFVPYIQELYEDITSFKSRGKTKEDRYQHFDFFTPAGFIKEEGKNFFLSFFLVKGEMNRFLKKRKRCKRDNGEKYQVKTKLYTWYCHRDGSNRFFLHGKKDFINTEEQLKRQYNTLLNYLKTIPVVDSKYLPPTKEIELYERISKEEKQIFLAQLRQQEQEAVIYPRRKDKFIELAIRYFMDRKELNNSDEIAIAWEVRNFEMEKVQKIQFANYKKDKGHYNKRVKEFHTSYLTGTYPVIRKRHIKFKLSKTDKATFIINQRELKNWLYYLLSYKNRKDLSTCIDVLRAYEKQHQSAMDELCSNNRITFENYPLVFEHGENSTVLSSMHKKILQNEKFNEASYRLAIDKALTAILNRMQAYLKAENYTTYTRHQKNRILMECFNWFLPREAKLKPDEVNQLSIYNFVAENEHLDASAREQIIEEVRYKLEKATQGSFELLQRAASLEEAYQSLLLKLLNKLRQTQQNLATLPLNQLHDLAAQLNVSLPGINLSRSDQNREEELKETIRRKPVLIPNGFFKRAFETADYPRSISTDILENQSWTQTLLQEHYDLNSQNQFVNHTDYGLSDISATTLQVVS